jgi:hypothetical protein
MNEYFYCNIFIPAFQAEYRDFGKKGKSGKGLKNPFFSVV